MSDLFALRRQFIEQFDLALPSTPQRDLDAMRLWENLLAEEWQEFQQALAAYKAVDNASSDEEEQQRMAELTAEGVDVLNVLVGLLLSQGLPLEAMTQAIHEANLRKMQYGQVLRRADGKIMKPAEWQPADKTGIIRQAQSGQQASQP